MAERDPAAIVRRHYDGVFTGRHLAALDEVIAPGFTGHAAGSGDSTIADMRRDIANEHGVMPGDETIVEEQLVAGDRVITWWRCRWKQTLSLFGEPADGDWLEGARESKWR